MERKHKLRFGVIGTGEFIQACHVPGLQSHPQAEVVALCGSEYRRTRSVANRLGIPDVHTDYIELCSRDDLDGVTIATPNAFHARQAVAAFRQGKHVLCEKPLALNVEEAEEMLRAAESSGKVHQVAFTFRYSYAVRELRRRIRSGDIGQPHYLRIQYDSWKGLLPGWKVGWRESRDLAGGGMLYDLGAHLFDVARFVLGPIEIVTGFVKNLPRLRTHSFTQKTVQVETDDIAAAWFRHESGVRGQWFVSRATPPYTDNGWLEVIGQEGALKASLSRGKVDILKISHPMRPDWEELSLPDEARDERAHCLGIMMQSFVDACLRGRLDGNGDASFVDGFAAQEAIAAVIEANEHLIWVPLRSCAINEESVQGILTARKSI
jgi:predicted dehydrogenase